MTDTEMLDCLEHEVRNGPILLHNTTGSNSPEWQGYRGRGLGLLSPRTLRQAIASMAGEYVRRGKIIAKGKKTDATEQR